MKLIIVPLAILVGLYAVYAAFVFYKQRDLLFPATRFPGGLGASPFPSDAEQIRIEVPGGQTEAWLFRPSNAVTGPVPVILFAHGNGELIEEWAPLLSAVRARGVGVLLVEYPGYGYSSGSPSEKSITAAMESAYDSLRGRDWVDPQRIVGYGRSLGGAAVVALSQRRPLAAIVMQSTFTSVTQFAHRFLVPEFLIRDPFDSLAAIRSYQGPVLVFHGRSDNMIPFENAEQLAAAAPDGRLVSLACAHNDCPPDWGRFWEDIFRFLRAERVVP